MEPLTMAAAAAPVLGSIASSAFSAFQANKQMDFQERMSSTAHQREVEDLRKAGLNPILSAKMGGSSTPPGAIGQVPDFGSSAKMGFDALEKVASIRNIDADTNIKKLQNQEALMTQDTRLATTMATLVNLRGQTQLNTSQRKQIDEMIKNLEIERDILRNQRASSGFQLSQDEAMSKFWKGPGGSIRPWTETLGPASDAAMKLLLRGRNLKRGF